MHRGQAHARIVQLRLGRFQIFRLFLANPRYFARFLSLTLPFSSIPTEYLNFCYIFPPEQRFIVPKRAHLYIFYIYIFIFYFLHAQNAHRLLYKPSKESANDGHSSTSY